MIKRIGVVGAGTVGAGVIQILQQHRDRLARRSGIAIELAAVAELDRAKALAAGTPEALLVDDYRALLADPQVDIVVELIGGTGVAEAVVREALEAGKAVVTANKALLAEKGGPLFARARQKKLPLAFEAAVAGGIPIILALRKGLVVNEFQSLLGIVNGTCNYILSEMIDKGVPYQTCLAETQALGYAEADPATDVDGFDSGHKLALLSALAFQTWVDFPQLHIEGIAGIDLQDIRFAQMLHYTVKLLAVGRPQNEEIFLSVHPALLPRDHPLASVHGSLNAIELIGDVVKESMFYGRGAGQMPTASAVTADIVEVARALQENACASFWTPSPEPAYRLARMEDYRSRCYLRFTIADRVGVLGRISTVLGEHEVSIASVHQHETSAEAVPLVIVTHTAREGDVRAALARIDTEDFVRAPTVRLRIEE